MSMPKRTNVIAANNAPLVLLEQAKQALAEVKTIPEAKFLRDQAEAIRQFLRVQGASFVAQQDAAEVKVRAERRIGELLGLPQPGKRTDLFQDGTGSDDLPPRVTQSRFRAAALLPEDQFEQHIAECREAAKEITSAALFKMGSRIARQARQRQRNLADEPVETPPVETNGILVPTGIVCGDALEILPTIPDNTFDLILPDPVYNLGVDYGRGPKADLLPDDVYLKWCDRWLRECYRVLKPTGTFWLIVGKRYADHLGVMLREIGFHRRDWVIWYETFGNCNVHMTNFTDCSRHLFYCTKHPKRFTWNAEAFNTISERQKKYHDKRANETGKILDNVWIIPRLSGTSPERVPDFPTQLPLALVEPIVLGCSRPGHFVFDPFVGTGTAGVAAARNDRKFLGIEINPEYAEIAGRRLAKIQN
jgi:DNA modification methylase